MAANKKNRTVVPDIIKHGATPPKPPLKPADLAPAPGGGNPSDKPASRPTTTERPKPKK